MNTDLGLDTLKVKFTNSITVREKKPYTIYEIEVTSTTSSKWMIYKRYSDFYTLHQELSKQHAASPHIRLPHLPPKRLTRSLAAEFVEKRKNELQKYQRDLLSIKELLHSQVLLKFLEVPDFLRGLIRAPSEKSGTLGSNTNFFPRGKMNQNQSYEETKVSELLDLLALHPNRVAALKSFEDYFFETKPRLKGDYIRQLFQGKTEGTGDGGLVQTCGDFSYSHVASRAALYLLCRLLDVEKNKDANSFLDQFVNLPTSILTKMQLHLHILSERGNRLGAFQIASLLQLANSRNGESIIEQIVTDTWARQEYYRWAERKIQHDKPPAASQEVELRSLILKDGHKDIVKEMFDDLLKIAKDEDQREWRVVTPLSPKMTDTQGLSISYKKDVFKDMMLLKLTTIIPFSMEQVHSYLMNFDSLKEWDPKFHDGKIITKLDSDTNVVHMVCKSFSSPYKFRDFCLLRSSTKLESGECLVGSRSILHPKVPESKDAIRAVLFPTGYVLTPIAHQDAQQSIDQLNREREERKTVSSSDLMIDISSIESNDLSLTLQQPASQEKISLPVAKAYCKYTYIAQMDKESVLIVSPDLLGETNELADTIDNLKCSLAIQYPKTGPPPQIPQDLKDPNRKFSELGFKKKGSFSQQQSPNSPARRASRRGIAPPRRPTTPRRLASRESAPLFK